MGVAWELAEDFLLQQMAYNFSKQRLTDMAVETTTPGTHLYFGVSHVALTKTGVASSRSKDSRRSSAC